MYVLRKRFTDTYKYDHSLFDKGPHKLTPEDVAEAEAGTPAALPYGSGAVDAESVEDALIPDHMRILEAKPIVEVEMI